MSALRLPALALIVALAFLRLCHVHLLWADEDYHLAAALSILHGKVPYRDFWYDKPPLNSFYYLAIGAWPGWPLRILDACYVLTACWLIYRLARALWTEAEAWTAALLLAFFTAFYLPTAVIPFAADALMLVPHLAAVYCAVVRRPLLAGAFAGIAFLINTKAVFVLAACGLWALADLPLLAAGFAIPVAAGILAALASGAWPGYLEQVWRWGFLYAKGSPVARPFSNALLRTANWLGFHAALAVSAALAFTALPRRDALRLGTWLALSFAAVSLGWRFAPHYFLQLLPPLVVVASRGIVLAFRRSRTRAAALLALLLLLPLIRFGPHYVSLAADLIAHRDPHWSDVALDLDSRDAARQINALAHPGDTLFVWGYRPDLYVYTRLTSDSRFWDSQPLTGVPADRHLSAITAIYGGPAAPNRAELARSRPTFLADGLGLLNPRLAPAVYPELRPWLAHYRLIGRTKLTLIYRRDD